MPVLLCNNCNNNNNSSTSSNSINTHENNKNNKNNSNPPPPTTTHAHILSPFFSPRHSTHSIICFKVPRPLRRLLRRGGVQARGGQEDCGGVGAAHPQRRDAASGVARRAQAGRQLPARTPSHVCGCVCACVRVCVRVSVLIFLLPCLARLPVDRVSCWCGHHHLNGRLDSLHGRTVALRAVCTGTT
jgi:hypothetical protein